MSKPSNHLISIIKILVLYQLESTNIPSARLTGKNTSSNYNRAAVRAANVEFIDYNALDTFR
jgi:hypothetical protein